MTSEPSEEELGVPPDVPVPFEMPYFGLAVVPFNNQEDLEYDDAQRHLRQCAEIENDLSAIIALLERAI